MEKGVYWCGGLNTPHELEHTAPRAPLPPPFISLLLPTLSRTLGMEDNVGWGPRPRLRYSHCPLTPCPSLPSSSPGSEWYVFGCMVAEVRAGGIVPLPGFRMSVCLLSPQLCDTRCIKLGCSHTQSLAAPFVDNSGLL